MHRNPCEVIWRCLAELFNLIKHLWALGRDSGQELGARLCEVPHITCCSQCCSEVRVELISMSTAAEPLCLAPWSIFSASTQWYWDLVTLSASSFCIVALTFKLIFTADTLSLVTGVIKAPKVDKQSLQLLCRFGERSHSVNSDPHQNTVSNLEGDPVPRAKGRSCRGCTVPKGCESSCAHTSACWSTACGITVPAGTREQQQLCLLWMVYSTMNQALLLCHCASSDALNANSEKH